MAHYARPAHRRYTADTRSQTAPMTSPDPKVANRYSRIAQWLHWLIAALIFAQYVLAQLAERAADAKLLSSQLLLLANHKSVGMTILGLAIMRLAWRLRHPPPPQPETLPGWQIRAAQIVHIAIYALIFAIPLSGWLLSSAAAYSVSWFGLFQWPDLLQPNQNLEDQLVNLHHWLAEALFIIVAVHIAAALKHLLVDKDSTVRRMFNPAAVALSVVTLAAAIGLLGFAVTTGAPEATAASPGVAPNAADTAARPEGANTESALPRWQIDPAQSEIAFIAEQAGARFEGAWQRWEAEIHFDADQLEDSQALVRVAADSANTQDTDRDETLSGPDWFAAQTFPEVRFQTQSIESVEPTTEQPHRFKASASLQVKSLSAPVEFFFDVAAEGNQRTLTGSASLDRLALGLGLGEWADPDSVGQFVTVQVTVVATVP